MRHKTISDLADTETFRHDARMEIDNKGLPRLDRTVMVVETLDALTDDSAYWATQTPEARLEALEIMRRINYGDAALARLQRVLEVVERP